MKKHNLIKPSSNTYLGEFLAISRLHFMGVAYRGIAQWGDNTIYFLHIQLSINMATPENNKSL
jgi:hypothetical protein